MRLLLVCTFLLFCFGSCLKGRKSTEAKAPEAFIDSVFLQYFRQTSGLTAAQGTNSILLSNGKTLWLFGNGHIDDYDALSGLIACTTNVKNAAMLSDSNFTMQTLNIGMNDFIPSNEHTKYFTPLHGYEYDDTVYIFAKKEGGGVNTRTYLAKFTMPTLQYLSIDSFNFNNTNYGYTVFSDTAKGFCFIYGLYQPNVTSENAMYLARFSLTTPHSQWQFYHPDIWYTQASSASSIASIPGENFSIRKIQQSYVLLTQQAGKACNKGTELYAQTGATEYGPFANFNLIYSISDRIGGNSPKTYGISLHPQFLNSSNEVLATYCVDGYAPCVPTCTAGYDNPDFYRIKTLRIPLKRISLGFK